MTEGRDFARVHQLRLAVVVPTRSPKVQHVASLARLMRELERDSRIAPSYIARSGSILPNLRASCAQAALDDGADVMLWIDDDMAFEPDTVWRLLAHDRDIVGTNYSNKALPGQFVSRLAGEEIKTNEQTTGLSPADSIGFGLVLIRSRVFRALPKPWFAMPYVADRGYCVGEDWFFCRAAKEAGFDIWIDHDASREVRHVGDFEYTWHYAQAERDNGTV